MIHCNQICRYNCTSDGCLKPEWAVCPMSNANQRVANTDNALTNADHIRSMSDEDLARFLAEVENRRSAAGGGAVWKGAAHAKEWLKQPYEN